MLLANTFKKITALTFIRMKLLLRQKLGWMSALVGVLLVLISIPVSELSFINPQKIFWDFSLGIIFVLQVSLAVFLGSQLYHEERGRRTLHLVLSAGVSRFEWLVGNLFGNFFSLSLMNFLWLAFTYGASAVMFEEKVHWIVIQSSLLLSVEVFIVLSFSILMSLVLRQMLALSFSALLVVLLHSMSSIQRVFTDPQVGRFVDDNGVSSVLWIARLLPPLEWLDLKMFVGYQEQVASSLVFQMTGLGIFWCIFLMCLSWLRFEKMDL